MDEQKLSMIINDRVIGPQCPVYVIAELSANHNQDLKRAEQIVHAAKNAGADAIKLQTYKPETMTIDCDRSEFLIGKGTIWNGQKLFDLYAQAHTPWEWHSRLVAVAHDLGMDCFSTPFDATAVDFLEELGVPCHKVASFEIVDIPLLQRIGTTGKPVIMSTGMASLSEIDEAVRTLRDSGTEQIALLKCTSSYPSAPEDMHLRTIPHMSQAFGVPTGLSDHTLGIAVPVVAVAMGACIIEKHFTLSRQDPGPDSEFSLEPHEFKAMVEAVRIAEKALGCVNYRSTDRETASRVFRRSLFVVRDVEAGEQFTAENVRSIRPGTGLPSKFLPVILGKRAGCAISRGTPLDWSLVS